MKSRPLATIIGWYRQVGDCNNHGKASAAALRKYKETGHGSVKSMHSAVLPKFVTILLRKVVTSKKVIIAVIRLKSTSHIPRKQHL